MKKLLTIQIAIVMVLSLCSCAKLTQVSEPQADGTLEDGLPGEYTENVPDPDSSFLYTEPEIPKEPTNEELGELIAAYIEFESYMTYDTPAVDYNSHMSDDPESADYYAVRITDPRMATPKAWENYLGSIFALGASSETPSADTAWVAERIAEHDGAMYYRDGGMGWPYTDEYVITGMEPAQDSDWLSVFFAREIDPDFRSNEHDAEYRVVRLDLTYTEDGWRIVLITEIPLVLSEWPDYVPKENLENYHPFEINDRYSDEELIAAARNYYMISFNYEPPIVDIDSYNGDEVVIHLYESTDDHTATFDWYTVNIYTGVGYDLLGNPIDIMNP